MPPGRRRRHRRRWRCASALRPAADDHFDRLRSGPPSNNRVAIVGDADLDQHRRGLVVAQHPHHRLPAHFAPLARAAASAHLPPAIRAGAHSSSARSSRIACVAHAPHTPRRRLRRILAWPRPRRLHRVLKRRRARSPVAPPLSSSRSAQLRPRPPPPAALAALAALAARLRALRPTLWRFAAAHSAWPCAAMLGIGRAEAQRRVRQPQHVVSLFDARSRRSPSCPAASAGPDCRPPPPPCSSPRLDQRRPAGAPGSRALQTRDLETHRR